MGQTDSKQETQLFFDFDSLMEKYSDIKKVNDFRFGEATILKEKISNQHVLLKEIISISKQQHEDYIQKLQQRYILRHENIIQLVVTQEFLKRLNHLYALLFTRFTQYSNIHPILYLKKLEQGLKEFEMYTILREIVQAMCFFQKNQLYHGDLRPNNIFLDETSCIKLADSGVTNSSPNYLLILNNQEMQKNNVYLSPQLLLAIENNDLNPQHDQYKSDVFTLGMILLYAGTLISSDDMYDYDFFKINGDTLELRLTQFYQNYGIDLQNLLRSMLEEDEDDRVDFIQLERKILKMRPPRQNTTNQIKPSTMGKPEVFDPINIQKEYEIQDTFNENKLQSQQMQEPPKDKRQIKKNEILQKYNIGVNDDVKVDDFKQKFDQSRDVNISFNSYISHQEKQDKNKDNKLERKYDLTIDNYELIHGKPKEKVKQSSPFIIEQFKYQSGLSKDDGYTDYDSLEKQLQQKYKQDNIPQRNYPQGSQLYSLLQCHSEQEKPRISISQKKNDEQKLKNLKDIYEPKMQMLQEYGSSDSQKNNWLPDEKLTQQAYQNEDEIFKKNYTPSHLLSDVQYAKRQSVKNFDSIDKYDYSTSYSKLEQIQKVSIQEEQNQKSFNKENFEKKFEFKKEFSAKPIKIDQPEFIVEQHTNGSVYEGYKLNNKRHGKGKFFYGDGGVYDGDWENNKMQGYGILYYTSGKPAYEGNWKSDKFQGKGILYNEESEITNDPFDYTNFNYLQNYWLKYDGEFKMDSKQGYGTLYLTNGEKFQGIFDNDVIQGLGKYFRMDGQVIEGNWSKNILQK